MQDIKPKVKDILPIFLKKKVREIGQFLLYLLVAIIIGVVISSVIVGLLKLTVMLFGKEHVGLFFVFLILASIVSYAVISGKRWLADNWKDAVKEARWKQRERETHE